MSAITPKTLLSELRSQTRVDCDTFNVSVAESLGPFHDCTSNQAIAYNELLLAEHSDLIRRSVSTAKELSSKYTDIKIEALAVEICMINLALRMLPHLTGRVHIQANPFDAYSTKRTIADGQRIISIFELLSPGLNAKERVCIKIPSTWEGLQACRILERDHQIRTLATTLFSLEQAAVAGEAGCTYIAPYVNELAVHFEKGYIDPSPNHHICIQSQLYFNKFGYQKTSTMPASLISINECLSLSGVSHMTIPPRLLEELATTMAVETAGPNNLLNCSLFQNLEYTATQSGNLPEAPVGLIDDEERFRMLFTRADSGRQEIKQVKAVNVFAEMQVLLEGLVEKYF